jgi:hypothetical protein
VRPADRRFPGACPRMGDGRASRAPWARRPGPGGASRRRRPGARGGCPLAAPPPRSPSAPPWRGRARAPRRGPPRRPAAGRCWIRPALPRPAGAYTRGCGGGAARGGVTRAQLLGAGPPPHLPHAPRPPLLRPGRRCRATAGPPGAGGRARGPFTEHPPPSAHLGHSPGARAHVGGAAFWPPLAPAIAAASVWWKTAQAGAAARHHPRPATGGGGGPGARGGVGGATRVKGEARAAGWGGAARAGARGRLAAGGALRARMNAAVRPTWRRRMHASMQLTRPQSAARARAGTRTSRRAARPPSVAPAPARPTRPSPCAVRRRRAVAHAAAAPRARRPAPGTAPRAATARPPPRAGGRAAAGGLASPGADRAPRLPCAIAEGPRWPPAAAREGGRRCPPTPAPRWRVGRGWIDAGKRTGPRPRVQAVRCRRAAAVTPCGWVWQWFGAVGAPRAPHSAPAGEPGGRARPLVGWRSKPGQGRRPRPRPRAGDTRRTAWAAGGGLGAAAAARPAPLQRLLVACSPAIGLAAAASCGQHPWGVGLARAPVHLAREPAGGARPPWRAGGRRAPRPRLPPGGSLGRGKQLRRVVGGWGLTRRRPPRPAVEHAAPCQHAPPARRRSGGHIATPGPRHRNQSATQALSTPTGPTYRAFRLHRGQGRRWGRARGSRPAG